MVGGQLVFLPYSMMVTGLILMYGVCMFYLCVGGGRVSPCTLVSSHCPKTYRIRVNYLHFIDYLV